MATLMLEDDEFKALEQVLGRIAQLTSSIQSLRNDIIRSNPLPPTSSLQASYQIIQRNLQSLLDIVNDNSHLLNRIAIHPSPSFPGRTQEGILGTLLRKKLEPDVEEQVAEGRRVGNEAMATPEGLARMIEVWSEARGWIQQRIAQYVSEEAGDVYTKEEREMGVENVRTGLRRDLEEDDDDEDDDDDDNEGDKKAPQQPQQQQVTRGPELETLLWFGVRGDFAVPPNIEYERKGAVYRGLQGVSIPAQDLAAAAAKQQQQQQQQQQQDTSMTDVQQPPQQS